MNLIKLKIGIELNPNHQPRTLVGSFTWA